MLRSGGSGGGASKQGCLSEYKMKDPMGSKASDTRKRRKGEEAASNSEAKEPPKGPEVGETLIRISHGVGISIAGD